MPVAYPIRPRHVYARACTSLYTKTLCMYMCVSRSAKAQWRRYGRVRCAVTLWSLIQELNVEPVILSWVVHGLPSSSSNTAIADINVLRVSKIDFGHYAYQ
jgi:hypothetical protein